MNSLLDQNSGADSSVIATRAETDHIRVEKPTMMMLKEQKTCAEDCLNSVRELKRCIPNHEGFSTDLQNYYQDLLKGGQALEIVAVEGDVKIDQAESDLNGLVRQVNSLFSMLEIYKCSSYQQKFDIKEYQVMLARIDDLSESLRKRMTEFEKLEQILNPKASSNATIPHLGEELSESKVQDYLKMSTTEQESWLRYEEITEKLAEVSKELSEKELKASESKMRVRELQERCTDLRQRLQEKESLIKKMEENLSTYAEKNAQLREESNDQFASMLADTRSRNEKQQDKAAENHSKQAGEIDEMISNLIRRRAQYTNVNPLFHYIMVLDHSGSMQGSRWEALLKALDDFVKKNQNQDSDLLSVITFDDFATEQMKKGKFSEYKPPVSSEWGETNFEPAFMMARDISKLSRSHRPVVVFLTDGDGKIGRSERILREMHGLHKDKGFMFFSIGVGDEYNIDKLSRITRTANNGEIFIDLGNERIEFLHKIRDEGLAKIFVDISNSINVFPLKINAAIEDLKKQKRDFAEESRQEHDFYTRRIKEKVEEVNKEQQKLLDRRIEVLEKKRAEEKDQIEFYKTDQKLFQEEIEALKDKIRQENQSIAPEEIEVLKKKKADLEQSKDVASKEKEKLSDDRNSILNELQKNKSNRNFSTSLQLFTFFQAKDNVESLKFEKKIHLGKFKTFIKSVQENSNLADELKVTETDLSNLEGPGVLDLIFEHYNKTLDLGKGQDIPNFRKIACQILEISETDTKNLEVLKLLIDSLHPRDFVDPSMTDNHQGMINACLTRKFQDDIESLNDEYHRLDEELTAQKEELEQNKEELKELKEEIDEAEENTKPKKEQVIRKLKALMNKVQKSDEVQQEYVRMTNQTNIDDIDEDYETKLIAAQEQLSSIEKKLSEKKSNSEKVKEKVKSLEKQMKVTKAEKVEINKKKSAKEREREKMKTQVFEYYGKLRTELMAKIHKYVKDARTRKIMAFQKRIIDNLVTPIRHYFS